MVSEDQRNVADRPEVRRDVVAPLAVAAGRALDEPAVLVAERDGHAVDLQLDDVRTGSPGFNPLRTRASHSRTSS